VQGELSLNETDGKSESLEETVRHLCERSIQLQEYSRFLKAQSQEINRRIQACLNSKRAA
jgi:hypothetical protein